MIINNSYNNENKDFFNNFYIESYGCQMNISDSEIVASIMMQYGNNITNDLNKADIIFINTCAIRDKAEKTIQNRLKEFSNIKRKKPNIIICLLGCMSKRIKSKFLEKEKLVDIIAGPDSYRDLPNLIELFKKGDCRSTVNVHLSKDETYADINPFRLQGNGITAFITITRGCDNMCTFCVVPFTRGRERSRDPNSIIKECKYLWSKGYKEVILLGQNVDSYLWYGGGMKKNFNKKKYNKDQVVNFSNLLELVANAVPKMRIRFSTSNPHDMSENVINIINKYYNICNHIHLPVQSGSSRILKKMNRKYSREDYVILIDKIRNIIPKCGISHDMIIGFSGESDADHKDTLSLMEYVKYDFGYMFAYSERSGTIAAKKMLDNVPYEVKKQRLQEVIKLQRQHSYYRMQKNIGEIQEILIDNISKKNPDYLSGRNSQNSVVVFPKEKFKIGDFVNVKIQNCTSATLIGKAIF